MHDELLCREGKLRNRTISRIRQDGPNEGNVVFVQHKVFEKFSLISNKETNFELYKAISKRFLEDSKSVQAFYKIKP